MVGAGAAAVAVIALGMTFGLPDLPVGSAQNKSSEVHGR